MAVPSTHVEQKEGCSLTAKQSEAPEVMSMLTLFAKPLLPRDSIRKLSRGSCSITALWKEGKLQRDGFHTALPQILGSSRI